MSVSLFCVDFDALTLRVQTTCFLWTDRGGYFFQFFFFKILLKTSLFVLKTQNFYDFFVTFATLFSQYFIQNWVFLLVLISADYLYPEHNRN